MNLQPEEIKQLILDTAQRTADKIYAKLQTDKAKERETLFDRRLYNTRLLLEHYRAFKEHAENAVFELVRLDEEELTAIEIMDSMLQSAGPGRGEIAVESIAKSVRRTQIVVSHIDEMLSIYESVCTRSEKPENMRRWDVIYTLFIAPWPKGKTKTDMYDYLAERHCTSVRQIQRDTKDALVRITALMFGVDGIRQMEQRR